MMGRNGSIPDAHEAGLMAVHAHRLNEHDDRLDAVEAEVKTVANEQRATEKQFAVLAGQIKLALWIVPVACGVVTTIVQIVMKLIH